MDERHEIQAAKMRLRSADERLARIVKMPKSRPDRAEHLREFWKDVVADKRFLARKGFTRWPYKQREKRMIH